LRKAAGINADNKVKIEFEPSKEWPEPEVPADLKKALTSDPEANTLWMDITPMARWDWLRWKRSTNKPGNTSKAHQCVALSKLKADKRRLCCFNRNQCTEPEVSKNGILIE